MQVLWQEVLCGRVRRRSVEQKSSLQRRGKVYGKGAIRRMELGVEEDRIVRTLEELMKTLEKLGKLSPSGTIELARGLKDAAQERGKTYEELSKELGELKEVIGNIGFHLAPLRW